MSEKDDARLIEMVRRYSEQQGNSVTVSYNSWRKSFEVCFDDGSEDGEFPNARETADFLAVKLAHDIIGDMDIADRIADALEGLPIGNADRLTNTAFWISFLDKFIDQLKAEIMSES